VSIVPLFPASSNPQNTDQEDFEREVASRFGLVPYFFRSAQADERKLIELARKG
jgi:hypothetical protein